MPFFAENNFFSNLKEENGEQSLVRAMRQMTHLHKEAGEEICKIGDIGREFYIILSGSASVLIPLHQEMNLNSLELYDFVKASGDKILWDKKNKHLQEKVK
jgi:hypothetical protein